MDTAALLAQLDDLGFDAENSQPLKPDHREEEEFPEPMPGVDCVTLISNDGVRFHVEQSVACVSGLLRAVFDPKSEFSESVKREMSFPTIRGAVLERIVHFMHLQYSYREHPDRMPKVDIPDELTVDLLVASDYFQI
jgi:hypothetical protein